MGWPDADGRVAFGVSVAALLFSSPLPSNRLADGDGDGDVNFRLFRLIQGDYNKYTLYAQRRIDLR